MDSGMIQDELCHDLLAKKIKHKLAFDENAEYDPWKEQVRKVFIKLNGLEQIETNGSENPNLKIEKVEKFDGYTRTRFTFESEPGTKIPCYLLVPDTGKEKYPVAICLQGHTTGFHLSIGEFKQDWEKDRYGLDKAFALQAVEHGFAALAIEQRAMGEREIKNPKRNTGVCCEHAAVTAILLGRTVIGERVWDVHKAIDLLDEFPQCDKDKIMVLGCSGGGTAAYYSACYDERIKLCMSAVALCTYEKSILHVYHCSCNYIPFVYEYCEMQDFSCLIAPRKLISQAGKADDIFLFEGTQKAYSTVEKIYEKAGAKGNCRFVPTEGGHAWNKEANWPAIMQETKKLNWF